MATSDGFRCERGEMSLSKALQQALLDCYSKETRRPEERRFGFRVGGQWFCPGCGVATTEEDGFVRCPRCTRSLNEFIPQLVELHPHRRPGEEGSSLR